MRDRERIISKISSNKKFCINASKPFNNLAVDFLDEFSNKLKKEKKILAYPNLIYLMFWCRKKRIEDLAKNYENGQLRLGRGLIFHICPSNVPTNFIYSFFFGLLSGNSNIIKIPKKDFKEKKIIFSTLVPLLNKKKYLSIKKTNVFIEYNNEIEITKNISSVCDGRVIWGGDKTINEIRKIWIPERSVELTFSDRYSLTLINSDHLQIQNNKKINFIVKNFYYDGYSMNQAACNSPHFVFWVGKKNKKLQNYFWTQLQKVVEKKFIFDDMLVVDKYSNLIENIISQNDFNSIKRFNNSLYVIDVSNRTKLIENIRGINGTFFQKNIRNINELKDYVTKKCQTVSYYGFSKEKLKFFLLNNNLFGIDRVVPIGKSLDIDITWDGYEIVKSLSRVISLE